MTESHDIALHGGGHDFRVRVSGRRPPNYLRDRGDDPHGYAFPGGHDLAGLPPVLMVDAELDSLRTSGGGLRR